MGTRLPEFESDIYVAFRDVSDAVPYGDIGNVCFYS